jgi:hypothetical protein
METTEIRISRTGLHGEDFVKTLAEKPGRFAINEETLRDPIKWQKKFRMELGEAMGLPLIRQRNIDLLGAGRFRVRDIRPVLVEETMLRDHLRQEWRIDSEPGYQLSFYLLKPLKALDPAFATRRFPLAIALHGHSTRAKEIYAGNYRDDKEKEETESGDRDIGIQAVRAGYIAICPDQRGFGTGRYKKDIEANSNNSCRTMQMHALLFGRTLIGERVWDVSRLIDFAKTIEQVDFRRIVITGNSGGGTTALFAAAMDARITVAVPGSYFCTFQDSIGAIDHCECNYIPGLLNFGEMADVAGLIAPRPFLAINGLHDPIFPIEATKSSFEKLKAFYATMGAEENCELFIGEEGHRYYKKGVWEWIGRKLKVQAGKGNQDPDTGHLSPGYRMSGRYMVLW